jgi:hypothetical protein
MATTAAAATARGRISLQARRRSIESRIAFPGGTALRWAMPGRSVGYAA